MSSGSLNLASRPFANHAPVVRMAVLLAIVALVLTAVNLTLYRGYFSGAGQEARDELQVIEQQIGGLGADLVALQGELDGYDLEAHNEQVEFLNQKIAERTFGWSRLFEDLDAVLPSTVRLEGMAPRIDGSSGRGGGGPVSLRLQGFARTEDGLLELIDKLFEHQRFEDPSPTGMSTREGQQQFGLTVTYLPDVGLASRDDVEPDSGAVPEDAG